MELLLRQTIKKHPARADLECRPDLATPPGAPLAPAHASSIPMALGSNADCPSLVYSSPTCPKRAGAIALIPNHQNRGSSSRDRRAQKRVYPQVKSPTPPRHVRNDPRAQTRVYRYPQFTPFSVLARCGGKCVLLISIVHGRAGPACFRFPHTAISHFYIMSSSISFWQASRTCCSMNSESNLLRLGISSVASDASLSVWIRLNRAAISYLWSFSAAAPCSRASSRLGYGEGSVGAAWGVGQRGADYVCQVAWGGLRAGPWYAKHGTFEGSG